jgi:hypothetical protein
MEKASRIQETAHARTAGSCPRRREGNPEPSMHGDSDFRNVIGGSGSMSTVSVHGNRRRDNTGIIFPIGRCPMSSNLRGGIRAGRRITSGTTAARQPSSGDFSQPHPPPYSEGPPALEGLSASMRLQTNNFSLPDRTREIAQGCGQGFAYTSTIGTPSRTSRKTG